MEYATTDELLALETRVQTELQDVTNNVASNDDLESLTILVRTIDGNVTTLSGSISSINSAISKINHLQGLKDVSITYLTEGDLLQYSSDGAWHNITPAELGLLINESTGGESINTDIVKALVKTEGKKYFLSSIEPDSADGSIDFNAGTNFNTTAKVKDKLQFGNYITGLLGTGGQIDKDGKAELNSLSLRSFLEVPELRFNKIDVVSGELWNSIAFGVIESVDTQNKIITLKLEEGEYSGIHVNDICRGIFHNAIGEAIPTDECGFEQLAGFKTSYFTPVEIIDTYGKKFRYTLKEGTTFEPCAFMKFAVYGNFSDPTRRDSGYSTRNYKRYLRNVQTWGITYENIASQFGLLDGLNIPGAPNNGNLTGNGAYLNNVYMTGATVQFTPEQYDALKGQSAYQVLLDHEIAYVTVNNTMNIISSLESSQLSFKLYVSKESTELQPSNTISAGKYLVNLTPTNVTCTFNNGIIQVTGITDVRNAYIDIVINCEGNLLAKKRIYIAYNLQGDLTWITYNDNDAAPERPTGEGITNGWHRNFTNTAIWMSSKSSIKVDEGTWGDPVRFVGASVAGSDGEYTAFAYVNSASKPTTPVSTQIPPIDATYTWTMYPPQRQSLDLFTWMTQATVHSDKTMTGWTEPIRITGDDGIDGTDGTEYEFIYKVSDRAPAPSDRPATSQVTDYIPAGWTDSPTGVTETQQYEWVSQRNKQLGVWSAFTIPATWSKWGEKGMDGDGYEYIFTRTANSTVIPLTPLSTQVDDYVPTIANGGSTDYNWADDPVSPTESFKATFVCKRVKTNGTWGVYSTPSLWSKWAETGLSGGNYQMRYKISSEKPTTNPDNDATWLTNLPDTTMPEGQYAWQIQRFVAADGTTTAWGNIIRLTGADGKDGQDGNSIEFIYTRNNTGIIPSTPPTNQTNDWSGTSTDSNNGNVTITWADNPQGVTDSIKYEYVAQRYKDKSTQQWGDYSSPGLWARYAEKGKDGDGYEYIYARFAEYQSNTTVGGPSGIYYPNTSSASYQNDGYVPTQSQNGTTVSYTDDPTGPTDALKYEYCWTRKKKESVWQTWSNGALWSKWSKDGTDSTVPGPAGESGYNYAFTEMPASIRSSKGFLQTTSLALSVIKTLATGSTSTASGYFAAYYRSNGTWSKISSIVGTSFTPTWSSSLSASDLWFGFNISVEPTPTLTNNSLSVIIPIVYDGQDGTNGSDGVNGTNGQDAYTIDLSNNTSTVNCNASGTVIGTIQTTTAIVYKGGSIDTGWTFSIYSKDGSDAVINSTSGAVTFSSNTLTKDTTGIVIQATKTGFSTKQITYTITKVYPGIDGSPAQNYWMIVSSSVINKDSSGQLTPTVIGVTKMKQVGSNDAVVTTDGTVTYNSYANGVSQSSGELTGGLYISEYWKYIDFEYRVNSVLVDKERVFIVSDGINGVDGVDGVNGSDANATYTIFRDRGIWSSSNTYYNCKADGTGVMSSQEYNSYRNKELLYVVDYVNYQGNIYICNAISTTSTPGTNGTWELSSKYGALTVNNLLANKGQLGSFNFSNNVFSSSNSKLILDSETGQLYCTDAIISGNVSTNKLIAKVTVENPSVPGTTIDYKISSVNENGDGAYIQYYPKGGGKRMELNAGNMIYYNNDGTVAWTLGASGDIVKATNNSYMWTDAISLISECQNKTLPSNIPSYPGQIYTTLDYNAMYVRKADTNFVQYSYRVCVGTGTYAQYNGLAVRASAVTYGTTDPSTISATDYMPDGMYFELGGMQPMTSPLNSSIAGYARMARKVTNHKDPAQAGSAYLFWWEGIPDTTSVYYNNKVLIAKLS